MRGSWRDTRVAALVLWAHACTLHSHVYNNNQEPKRRPRYNDVSGRHIVASATSFLLMLACDVRVHRHALGRPVMPWLACRSCMQRTLGRSLAFFAYNYASPFRARLFDKTFAASAVRCDGCVLLWCLCPQSQSLWGLIKGWHCARAILPE